MRYTEFEGIVCHLGKEYDVNQKGDYIYVVYENNAILKVYTQNTFRLVSYDELRNCPKKQEVWNAATVLAATPLDEREEEKKYNVIVVFDNGNLLPFTVWGKTRYRDVFETHNTKKSLLISEVEDNRFQFTDSEFKDLIKYIKTLPDGEFQAKVAKHGKKLVKGE